jgi:hypothetical protein
VNRAQKVLTAVVLILFTATLLCFPWSKEGRYFLPSPFWVSPEDFYPEACCWTRGWIIVGFFWGWLVIMYCGLLVLFNGKKGEEECLEEKAMSGKDWRCIIFSIAIIGAALIYASATRFTYIPKTGEVLDRWTGQTRHSGDGNSFDPDAYLRSLGVTPKPSSD